MISNKQKLVGWLIAFALGIGASQAYSSSKYVELLPTKSGTFIVKSGHIFQLAELNTDRVEYSRTGGIQ